MPTRLTDSPGDSEAPSAKDTAARHFLLPGAAPIDSVSATTSDWTTGDLVICVRALVDPCSAASHATTPCAKVPHRATSMTVRLIVVAFTPSTTSNDDISGTYER